MKIGIIAAMDEEIKVLLENIENKQEIKIHNFVFYEGCVKGKSVVLVKCGIGKVMSAIATTLLINNFKVSHIINTGSAGGIGKNIKINDVVIADKLVYSDVDLTAFAYEFGQMANQPLFYEADKQMLDVCQQLNENLKFGLIASSDSFIASESKVCEIKNHFQDCLAVEMESASIAQACFNMQTPFLIVRCISDSASEKAQLSFDEFILQAGKTSAQFVMNFLSAFNE